jgi:hypothetical protein
MVEERYLNNVQILALSLKAYSVAMIPNCITPICWSFQSTSGDSENNIDCLEMPSERCDIVVQTIMP